MTIAFKTQVAHERLSRQDRIGQQLHLLDEQGDVAISFVECIQHNLGLDLRKNQVRRDVVGIVRKFADFHWKTDTLVCVALTIRHPAMMSLLDLLVEHLATMADRPLTPKELLAALPITNRERLRWTKDKRLKRSGDVKIKPGQIVTIATYSVSATESILADRAILDRWREADRLAKA
tara:strand:+ start:309 stop:842 length:534 start_codon:yes stop_codon:yes gene_type:complete